jgi:hypothetical protein
MSAWPGDLTSDICRQMRKPSARISISVFAEVDRLRCPSGSVKLKYCRQGQNTDSERKKCLFNDALCCQGYTSAVWSVDGIIMGKMEFLTLKYKCFCVVCLGSFE